jgi:hypothetical protein
MFHLFPKCILLSTLFSLLLNFGLSGTFLASSKIVASNALAPYSLVS